MIKISIIMPVFNDENYLQDAIESVYNQTFSDIELICINDGSSDDSLEILNKLSLKYDFIKIFSQSNQGSGSARNKGLDNANGEYIAFLDADDFYVDDNALEIMYDVAKSSNSDMVSANLTSVDQSRNVLNSNYNCKDKYYCFDEYCEISPDEYGIPWSFYKNIFKRDIIEANHIRFPDLLRGQDPVFLSKVLSKIDKIQGVPITFYGYMIPAPGKNLLDTSIKKLHYLTHYKQTFKILEENNLFNILEKYKKDLIRRLKIFDSQDDIEGYEIFLEVFGLESHYLENYNDFLESLYVKYLLEKVCIENSKDYFDFVKKEFLRLDPLKNNEINEDHYNKINLILQNEDFQKFKEEYLKSELEIHSDKIKKLSKDNKKLRKKYKKLKKLNNELLNSKSIRFTRFLRK